MSSSEFPIAPLIVIAGPTAVGKTSLAIHLAELFDGEIVNADSRSFYRGMDIGTAKPSIEDQTRIRHHLMDILDPSDEMSLSMFQRFAFTAIDDVLNRGKIPLLVGGTAQYLNAVVENWRIPQVAPDHVFRATMDVRLAADGLGPLIEELRLIDPESVDRTGPNPRRIIRALEVFHATGTPMSQLQGRNPLRYRALELELWLPRDLLHRRIADRTDGFLSCGLISEVRSLLAGGLDPSLPAFSSIGYREVLFFLNGEQTLDDTRAAILHNSNRLVRHQQTWFRKNLRMIRMDMTSDLTVDLAQRLIAEHIHHKSVLANESQ